MNLEEMGKQIRKRRLEKNWRQEDLAERTDLTATYISLIERGKKCPTLETFVIIANTLNVSADELLAADVNNGYVMRMSQYLDKISELNLQKQKQLLEIMDVLLRDI